MLMILFFLNVCGDSGEPSFIMVLLYAFFFFSIWLKFIRVIGTLKEPVFVFIVLFYYLLSVSFIFFFSIISIFLLALDLV